MFPTRQVVRSAVRLLPSHIRPMSAKAGPLVDLAVDNDGVAVLTMQRAPVNSLNLDLLQALSKSLDDVAKSEPKGLILTSSLPTVFSAGLDLTVLHKPDLKTADMLWTALQEVWIKLYGSSFITAAAVNGHAPAGGCLLTMTCEYRAMVGGKYTIGLNESAIGILPPVWLIENMCQIIGTRKAEFALTSSKLFTVDEALEACLIDDVASDKADAIEKCKQFIKKYDRIPSFARAATKKSIREATLKGLMENRRQDTDIFISFLKRSDTQEAVKTVLEKLQKRASL